MKPILDRSDLPQDLADDLNEVLTYMGVRHIAARIWTEVLTNDEKVGLDEDDRPRKIVSHLAMMRGCSLERALLDIAADASVIEPGRRTRLLRRLGEAPEGGGPLVRPHWDPHSGELTYRGRIIRSVSARAKNVRLLLQAFQELHWQVRIDNPLSGGANSKPLRDAIARLNKGLERIKFSADGRARGIRWQECEQRRRDDGP